MGGGRKSQSQTDSQRNRHSRADRDRGEPRPSEAIDCKPAPQHNRKQHQPTAKRNAARSVVDSRVVTPSLIVTSQPAQTETAPIAQAAPMANCLVSERLAAN
jgi:hypothetical protein